ncbi:MAG TPA: nicotinate-nicotinamide nucleotide adenylyltransferase [Candidatus Saccharimonadales bacterium]|nr:nicotinate-nicotinamide nucleotide adenylyltransferase [Candidatus Saccharimonadales bacterium]
MSRIGIFSGSFNPIHSGHIAFALQALESANLDKVYFLPERRPALKQVEHFGHRVAMIKQAIMPHPKFNVLELTDISFSVERTLPKLQTLFAGEQLVFLTGSDVAEKLIGWPKVDRLLKSAELVIGVRVGQDKYKLAETISQWQPTPLQVIILDAWAPKVSSSKVRAALRNNKRESGILASVERYSNKNWLYVSIA